MTSVRTINTTKQVGKVVLVNGLECDPDNVANKLANGVMEANNAIAQLWHLMHAVPELRKVTLFQDICQILDLRYCFILRLKQFIMKTENL